MAILDTQSFDDHAGGSGHTASTYPVGKGPPVVTAEVTGSPQPVQNGHADKSDIKSSASTHEARIETLGFRDPPLSYPVGVPKGDFELQDHGIDEIRSLRVVVIGAGLSGVLASILLPVKVPKIDLVVYEKNEDVVCIATTKFRPTETTYEPMTDQSVCCRAGLGWKTSTLEFVVM